MDRLAKIRQRQQGFTLVEMAIVLVVIGLILGAVMIGKDVQRNAEYAKIANKFVMGWKKSYDEYYQRTGVVLGDSQVAPTYMIDGKEAMIGGQPASQGNVGGSQAGIPENYTNAGLRICHGQGYPKNTVDSPFGGDHGLGTLDLLTLMQQAGVTMPPGRGEGKQDRYLYLDSNGNPTEVQVCFQYNKPGTTSGAGNVMVLRGLTPALARYLDQIIDGKADALEGRFRIQDDASNSSEPSSQKPGQPWAFNNTYKDSASIKGQSAGNNGKGEDKDEDRVVLLTAQWIMAQ